MLNKKSKGFTLIELLVVIAIIGILASIVLVSLGGARNRARDARITAALTQVRPIAEITNASTGVYDTICTGAGAFGTAEGISVISADIAANQSSASVLCKALNQNYCIAVGLNNGGVFCVSSDGIARTITTGSTTVSAACPATTSSCGA